ncbi:hypothetical protein D3C76_1326800 [compost metagenome]
MGADIKVAFTTAGSDGPQQAFALQRVTVVAVGPAVGEHFVDPQFEQWRCAVPLHRMLPDDKICAGYRLLFGGDIDVEVRIKLIEGAYLYAVDFPCLLKHPLIRMRVLRIRMRINYQNHCIACFNACCNQQECRQLIEPLTMITVIYVFTVMCVQAVRLPSRPAR